MRLKCEECPARVSTIDLGTFGVVQVKLWSENVENHEIYNFTVVLSLFTEFGFHENVWNFQPESIKLNWVLSEFCGEVMVRKRSENIKNAILR